VVEFLFVASIVALFQPVYIKSTATIDFYIDIDCGTISPLYIKISATIEIHIYADAPPPIRGCILLPLFALLGKQKFNH